MRIITEDSCFTAASCGIREVVHQAAPGPRPTTLSCAKTQCCRQSPARCPPHAALQITEQLLEQVQTDRFKRLWTAVSTRDGACCSALPSRPRSGSLSLSCRFVGAQPYSVLDVKWGIRAGSLLVQSIGAAPHRDQKISIGDDFLARQARCTACYSLRRATPCGGSGRVIAGPIFTQYRMQRYCVAHMINGSTSPNRGRYACFAASTTVAGNSHRCA